MNGLALWIAGWRLRLFFAVVGLLFLVRAPADAQVCVGDCDGNGKVSISELIKGVNIALDLRPASDCEAFGNSVGQVTISQLTKGVNNALRSCEENVFFADRVINIAHRGGNVLAPEQTIPAWESALDVGTDVLEMDMRATADGALVLIHDQTVDRTTDGTGLVGELTFDEIRALDAGYNFTPDGGLTYPFRGQGIVVPTVAEVIERFRGIPLNVEIKAENTLSVIDPFIELLDRYEMRDKVLVASFDAGLVQAFREAAPDILTSFSLDEATGFFLLSPEEEETYTPPAEFLQVPPAFGDITVMTEEFVAKVKRHGLFVHVWDVDSAEEMREMIALGADGLIVDDPQLLTEVLNELD